MSEWNFMDAASRHNVMTAWRKESDTFFDLVAGSGWEDQTACSLWQVRDVVGHLVDTTEAYFVSFDAARGQGEAPEALGLPDMARYVDEGAKASRGVPQAALVDRLRDDRERMLKIAEGLTDDEWSGLMVPHKYMGPLPACFYPIFQVVDYTVHGWDIPQGTQRGHAMRGDSADLLVPLCFVLWQSTAVVPPDTSPYSLGVRITSGHNAGDTRVDVSPDGLALEPGPIDDLPVTIEFDPASFVLTAYGRVNGGTTRGDSDAANRFLSLFFRI
jgi:uncharacterized protein (TIGR03083 family)